MQYVQDHEFQLIKRLIYNSTGIFLKDHKKTMVANRLRKRVELLGLKSYKQYYDYIVGEPGGHRELSHFINNLTTNETFFYRHHEQIDYCIGNMLPELQQKKGADKTIRIWSAGCSSGEEPYTIAIMMDQRIAKADLSRINIVATDVNEVMIHHACQGVYNEYAVQKTPKYVQTKYFYRDIKDNRFYIKQEIKDRVQFHKHNLLEPFHQGKFDIIFCRNVLIYFDTISKEKVIKNFIRDLNSDGFLILSFTESLLNMRSHFSYVRPSIYRRLDN